MNIVPIINKVLWDWVLLFLLCGTGIYFTIRLRFVQIRRFGAGMKHMFASFSLNGRKAGKDGMNAFQALSTAVAAQVGTGNIAGAATAIVSGGPGAIFWMWVSAFFGMATIYAEAVLAQKTKTIGADGAVTGGPVYYIRKAFSGTLGKVLAVFFSIAIILALGFMGNMVQSNSIGEAFHNAFGLRADLVSIVVAVLAVVVFLGGVKRLAWATEKIVPVMALLYVVGSLVVIFMNVENLPETFRQIFVGAFAPQAVMGGALGVTVQQAMRYGVARGLFSNEAGMGSTPHAHAIAKVEKPEDQGVLAMMGVFIDTFIVVTMTALVIVSTGSLSSGQTGAALTQLAFSTSFGSMGSAFIAICLLFFAFSTILGWYFFGEVNVRALFGPRAVKVYALIVAIFVAAGSLFSVDVVWALSDLFNGLMVIPNLLGLLALSGTVALTCKKSK